MQLELQAMIPVLLAPLRSVTLVAEMSIMNMNMLLQVGAFTGWRFTGERVDMESGECLDGITIHPMMVAHHASHLKDFGME